jgi:hypothetical protein
MQERLDHIAIGCLYDFMAWLTTRDEELVLSAHNDAAPAAEAVEEFLKTRGIDELTEPDFNWAARCK